MREGSQARTNIIITIRNMYLHRLFDAEQDKKEAVKAHERSHHNTYEPKRNKAQDE